MHAELFNLQLPALTDFGLGAVQYSGLGAYWLGKNWNIYNPAWGGNQYAGSRSLAPTC